MRVGSRIPAHHGRQPARLGTNGGTSVVGRKATRPPWPHLTSYVLSNRTKQTNKQTDRWPRPWPLGVCTACACLIRCHAKLLCKAGSAFLSLFYPVGMVHTRRAWGEETWCNDRPPSTSPMPSSPGSLMSRPPLISPIWYRTFAFVIRTPSRNASERRAMVQNGRSPEHSFPLHPVRLPARSLSWTHNSRLQNAQHYAFAARLVLP